MNRFSQSHLFQWSLIAFSAILLSLSASCEKKPQPGPGDDGGEEQNPDVPDEIVKPELKNQFAFDKDTVDIRTVLYETDKEGILHLFLSPRPDIEYFEDLMSVQDFVSLQLREADGPVDPDSDFFSLAYGDFLADQSSAGKMDSLSLSADLSGEYLYLEFFVRKGKSEFSCRYQGAAAEFTPVPLNNEWEFNRDITSIGSAVEYRLDGVRHIYLYHGENVTTLPEENELSDYVHIVTPEDLFGEFDLSDAPGIQEIAYHDLRLSEAEAVSGSLTIRQDKSGRKLSIELESEIDGDGLRVSWSGERRILLDMENRLDLTLPQAQPISMELGKVFMEKDRLQTTRVAFGTNPDPASWEDLKSGYAVQFNVLEVGETLDLSQSQGYGLQIFDYEKFKTYDASELGAEGTLRLFDDPNGDEGIVGFFIDATLGNGIHVLAEWYGGFVPVDRFDLTPVPPQSSYLTITDKDGKVTERLPLLELKVVDKPSFQSQVTGAVFHAVEFSFINENTLEGGLNASTTPILALNASCIGRENTDLTKEQNLFDFRYTPFSSNGIASPSDWSGTTTQGSVTAIETEDGLWKIRLEIKDYGDWWGLGNPTGSESVLLIEWEGPANDN